MFNNKDLRSAIDRMPRVSLANIPTPIQELTSLTKFLGGPRILVKRDDLTGLGLGGNKVRHMEFCMGDALARGFDTSVNANLWISNNSRIIGAASKKVGMRYICVVVGGKNKPKQGNMLILDLLGTEMHLTESRDMEEGIRLAGELSEQVEEDGGVPYLHTSEPMSRSSGSIGYLDALLEINDQLNELQIHEPKIYVVTGASHGGLALGVKLLSLPWAVIGVHVAPKDIYFADTVGWANTAAELMGLPARLNWEDIDETFDYIGPGYPDPSLQCLEAIRLMAELEGVILEPIYTGKALAAVIDHIRQGVLTSEDTVLFMHTGGLPELFNFADTF
ncbi:MAG: D-cysteine desulfhydrase/L-cysteate sulfo-lyase [Chloroflexi bacterium]|jgi:1-aminocyclopropane-1-carboxylate deaminase/D-cysteine desulfhydrase-like pyridoxal-dependent ACC family enzyme|nr:MAG: D-cysteine desulfhydrase/L-cysteate sulfo-lyase [Chloroflexota bacterium]